MASQMYALGIQHAYEGDFNWQAVGGDDFRAALVLSAYTPNPDTDEFVSAIGTNRANASAADVADVALTEVDANVDAGNDEVEFDASNQLTYAGVDDAQVVRAIVVFKFITNDASSLLLSYNQFASDLNTNGSDVEVTIDAEGVFKIGY